MLSVPEVKQILRSDTDLTAIFLSDNIKGYALPKELKTVESVPILLITDIRAPFTNFASDHAGGRFRTVQIQGWFSVNDTRIEQAQLIINSIMEDNLYYNSFDGGIDLDPDFPSLLFFTMQYSKNDNKLG